MTERSSGGNPASQQAHFQVLEDDCIGCALCMERAPENLEIVVERAVARITAQPANDEQEQACLEAADYCPIGALSVTDPDPADEYPPDSEVAAVPSS